MDFYGFYTGTEFHAYEYLGAHITDNGVIFRTFAPNADRISVIGDFNNWLETPMQKTYDGNFWECSVENAAQGMKYKYRIYDKTGRYLDHCDPYAFYSDLRPETASIIYPLISENMVSGNITDSYKALANTDNLAVNIYEIHAGSWKKPNENADSFYTYAELADLLIPYLIRNGYNFVEIMPISEYPCDESWGYQVTGFFSPTSRYGTPDDLRCFIDKCHHENIGVLLDFVPVHFALNDYALFQYDGTALFEYPHNDVGINEWGSCNFIHSRGEVRSFLQSSACYWLSEFHFDGLRVDAVSNLIYWQGNPERGENKQAIQFIRNMNQGLKELFPYALLIAEDSSTYKGVTDSVENGGLGFDYKWDLGWMNDTLSFLQSAPNTRKLHYHKLTFSMHYYYNEKYLLPLSHDEVVHGKATIVQKMNGADYEEKFAQARALYMYMYAHPGKKLNFMGNEIAHMREWDEKRQQDWDLLQYPSHDAFHHFMIDLNDIYLGSPALYENDYERKGFVWTDCKSEKRIVYSFLRICKTQKILAIFNFSDKDISKYEVEMPDAQKAILILNSDWECYGGTSPAKKTDITIKQSIMKTSINRFSALFFLIR
ncbi:MAG: 1,4-alpha-glucan branching protein GlgB [Bacillus sp. (in: Bacteria)]|nr:1,4-alpha-glucan branching protein GlgB [Bacillus sp. (in: firmicutes)]MCM1426073.1 1,4-alpha-glucan branching protein GlgB [Eubacterium sp.]